MHNNIYQKSEKTEKYQDLGEKTFIMNIAMIIIIPDDSHISPTGLPEKLLFMYIYHGRQCACLVGF